MSLMFNYYQPTVNHYMWIIKKAKQKLTKSSQPFEGSAEFKLIQQLSNIKGKVLPIPKLEDLSHITFDQQKCEAVFNILELKVTKYLNKKQKIEKMFKILVIIDYILLNGATALVDLFTQNLQIFEKLTVSSIQGSPNLTGNDLEVNEMIGRKAEHIVQILKNKEKRLQQKVKLNQAKLMLKQGKGIPETYHHEKQLDPQNQLEIQQPEYSYSLFKKRPKVFQKVEKFMQKRLLKLTSALIGLIDPDYEISDDYLKNKQFMQRGENIIEEEENQKGGSYQEGQNKQEGFNCQQKQKQTKEVNDNLLGLQIQFL